MPLDSPTSDSATSRDSASCEPPCSTLPEFLRPESPFEFATTITQFGAGQICYSCRKLLPRNVFSKHLAGGKKYLNRRCNRCRFARQLASPAHQERQAWIDYVKSVPCCDCKKEFPAPCMTFDPSRGKPSLHLQTAWRWARREVLQSELLKNDVVCVNCVKKRRHERYAKSSKRLRILADVQRQAESLLMPEDYVDL